MFTAKLLKPDVIESVKMNLNRFEIVQRQMKPLMIVKPHDLFGIDHRLCNIHKQTAQARTPA